MVQTVSFLLKPTLKFYAKYQFLVPSKQGKWGAVLKGERDSFPLEWFMTFLGWIWVRFDDIYISYTLGAPYDQRRVISLKTTLNFHVKYKISGTLSAHEMGWCDILSDIHCCLNVFQPSSDGCMGMIRGALDRVYEHFIVHTMSFLSKTTLKFHIKQ